MPKAKPEELCRSIGLKHVSADSEYDPMQLKIGVSVEMEHTDNPQIAKCIAKHHLDEQKAKGLPQTYYTELKKMEQTLGL